jgi:hypothetical protein
LRVKDVDFGRGLITVRSGKGDKDRVHEGRAARSGARFQTHSCARSTAWLSSSIEYPKPCQPGLVRIVQRERQASVHFSGRSVRCVCRRCSAVYTHVMQRPGLGVRSPLDESCNGMVRREVGDSVKGTCRRNQTILAHDTSRRIT